MKLFENLRKEYGQNVVRQVRDLETAEKKLARYRNHLVFTLCCKDESVTPPSLTLRRPFNTANGRKIIEKAEKELMRERIRVVNDKIKTIRSDCVSARNNLEHILLPDLRSRTITLCEKSPTTEV